MPYGPKNLRISFTAKTLSHFGGVYLLYQFLSQLGLRGLISQRIRLLQRNHRYSISDMLLALIYPMMLGLDRIETTHLLRRNGVFQYLSGLPTYPNPTTLRRFLLRFNPWGLRQLFQLHDHLRKQFILIPSSLSRLIFDLDSTVLTVYGKLQGAHIGYNPHKRGRPSYHPVICFEARTRDCWHAIFRPGDAHPGSIALEFVKACLAKTPSSVYSIRIRGDVGFYDRELIEYLDGRRIGYAIIARLTQPLQRKLGGVRFQSISPLWQVGRLQYQPIGWKKPHKFILMRKLLPETHSEQAQLTLFQLDDWAYHILVTNLSLRPENIWRFYHQRAAVELIIRELKHDYPLGKIPTRYFAANEAYFHLLLLAYNLINWFKRLCLPEEFHSVTLQTLRTQLLLVPGELVNISHHPILKLPKNFLRKEAFEFALKRIRSLQI
jgi:hypothetical protein